MTQILNSKPRPSVALGPQKPNSAAFNRPAPRLLLDRHIGQLLRLVHVHNHLATACEAQGFQASVFFELQTVVFKLNPNLPRPSNLCRVVQQTSDTSFASVTARPGQRGLVMKTFEGGFGVEVVRAGWLSREFWLRTLCRQLHPSKPWLLFSSLTQASHVLISADVSRVSGMA